MEEGLGCGVYAEWKGGIKSFGVFPNVTFPKKDTPTAHVLWFYHSHLLHQLQYSHNFCYNLTSSG